MHGSPPDDKEEAEAEMSTAEQMKAMRIELGLNVHSLDAAVEKQSARYETAESFDDDELEHEEWPKMAWIRNSWGSSPTRRHGGRAHGAR